MARSSRPDPTQPRPRRAGRPRRSDDDLKRNDVTPEGIQLIRALDALIDASWNSRHEFLAHLAERFGEGSSSRTLSAQFGGERRYRHGPTWKVAYMVVRQCAPAERRLAEIARIAGLWAHAHGTPRPPDYDGPVLPVVAASDPAGHLKALLEGFPTSQRRHHCPRRSLPNRARWLVRLLLVAALPWLAVPLFDLRIGGDWRAVALMEALLVGVVVMNRDLWFVRLRPDRARFLVEQPVPMGAFNLELWRPVQADGRPVRAGSWPLGGLLNDLRWTLAPGEEAVTPLAAAAARNWWQRAGDGLSRGRTSACTNGSLAIDAGTEPVDPGEGAPFRSGSQQGPLVEWSLVDDRGHLYATGVLGVTPEDQFLLLGLPRSGEVLSSPPGDGVLPGTGRSITGEISFPWTGQIVVLLRRLDSDPRTVGVWWLGAGVHLHRTTTR
jgi:hypothetical protein